MDIANLKPVETAIIIGASSGIAKAIAQQLYLNNNIKQVITISQNDIDYGDRYEIAVKYDIGAENQIEDEVENKLNHLHITSDYSQQNIATTCQSLSSITGHIVKVFICNGRLHTIHKDNKASQSQLIAPEKRLEDINPESMQALFNSNAIVPMLWLQNLVNVLKGKQQCVISVLSARVGSISDNHLGGWYSYRATKSALNMLIKTCAIEYARRAKNCKLIAFHPGTTDTDLSKPFQANVPEGKLFTAEFVAKQLLGIHQELTFDCEAEFLDWQGKTITW
ncbi:SDR family NAD(P)-dependent oxidoreductase [Shewanella olleyana]|uniref:SDR family NAD(P)-dependent oxidoreductase n=1 Tax=Shewanella olleyana TaxID=135626 RepID=UPI00200DAC89|nr:SDR family NAD(P)-dependent oxidoreductase [Shewanella olleyana]MCL1065874.1 SDR family NAD(P)-dependent oxidoreductase [Shewanella olleyana]